MADVEDIVVIGKPEDATTGNYTVQSAGGTAGSGPDRQIRENQQAAANSFKTDADASDDEIVVIGQKVKSVVQNVLMQLTPRGSATITLPCVGAIPADKLRAIAANIQFQVKTQEYGPGRAGKNLADSTKGVIPVEINKAALKLYDQNPGGLNYLVLHELAHSIKQMRDFNQAEFEAYRHGAGKDLSLEQQREAFILQPGGIENEARANSIAKSLSNQLNSLGFSFNPPNGFSSNCMP